MIRKDITTSIGSMEKLLFFFVGAWWGWGMDDVRAVFVACFFAQVGQVDLEDLCMLRIVGKRRLYIQ